MSPAGKGECAICKVPAKQTCGACQAVYYCSREHQTADWKQNHAKECRAACRLVAPQSSPAGECGSSSRPHYVATRDINIGETVLVDGRPLLTGPCFDTKSTAGEEIPPHAICFGCYRKAKIDLVKICRKCNMIPLCNLCTKHGAECDFLAKHGKNKFDPLKKYSEQKFKALLTVKALALRDTDPENYRKLLTLEERCIGNARCPNDAAADDAGEVARYVKKLCDIEHIELAEVARISAILQARAHPIDLPNSMYAAVYFKASYIDHSCRANCSKSFTADGGMIVWAAVPISKGERISINYIPAPLATMGRQNYLAKFLYFDCTCELCKDPTEFGTMYSVFGCIKKNCTGFMLPSSFLFANRESTEIRNFTCNKCGAVKTWNEIERMHHRPMFEFTSMENIDAYRRYIASCKPLHENNHFNIIIEVTWCLSFISDEFLITNCATPILEKAIDTSVRLDQLFKTITPAENRLRGQLLFVQFQARSALFRRDTSSATAPKIMEFVAIAKKLLTEIYSLMHREPSTSKLDTFIKSCVVEKQKTIKVLEGLLFVFRIDNNT